MIRTRRPRSQGWKTFLRNQAAGIASIDLFVVRTISFQLLYGLVILHHARRRLARIAVTTNPTAEWIAGQVTEAFPWSEAPAIRYTGLRNTNEFERIGLKGSKSDVGKNTPMAVTFLPISLVVATKMQGLWYGSTFAYS